MTNNITDAQNTLATAAALGLPVTAPTGTHFYHCRAAQFGDVFTDGDVLVSGQHSTYESAINQILHYVIDTYDKGNVDAPWLIWLFERGVYTPTPDQLASARQHWLDTHTDEQICDSYFTEDFGTWSIKIIKVQNPRIKPFTRNA
jgi:hypothetical protein